jgi:hypothetical protein
MKKSFLMNSDIIKTYIYESPDGGDTVYRRMVGSLDREMIREGPSRKKMLRNQLWRDIFESAESDPILQDMLDRVEIYHRLKDSP